MMNQDDATAVAVPFSGLAIDMTRPLGSDGERGRQRPLGRRLPADAGAGMSWDGGVRAFELGDDARVGTGSDAVELHKRCVADQIDDAAERNRCAG